MYSIFDKVFYICPWIDICFVWRWISFASWLHLNITRLHLGNRKSFILYCQSKLLLFFDLLRIAYYEPLKLSTRIIIFKLKICPGLDEKVPDMKWFCRNACRHDWNISINILDYLGYKTVNVSYSVYLIEWLNSFVPWLGW